MQNYAYCGGKRPNEARELAVASGAILLFAIVLFGTLPLIWHFFVWLQQAAQPFARWYLGLFS